MNIPCASQSIRNINTASTWREREIVFRYRYSFWFAYSFSLRLHQEQEQEQQQHDKNGLFAPNNVIAVMYSETAG